MWMGGRGSFGLNYGKEPVMQRYEHARWRNKQCEDSDGKEHRHHLCVHAKLLSRVQIFATPWTVALQAPLSMGSPRQEYWSGVPFPSPEDLPNPGIESLVSCISRQVLYTTEPAGKPINQLYSSKY